MARSRVIPCWSGPFSCAEPGLTCEKKGMLKLALFRPESLVAYIHSYSLAALRISPKVLTPCMTHACRFGTALADMTRQGDLKRPPVKSGPGRSPLRKPCRHLHK